jgi:hypothetical protein
LGLKERLSDGGIGEGCLRVSRRLILEARKTNATFEPSTSEEKRNHLIDILFEQFGCGGFAIDN